MKSSPLISHYVVSVKLTVKILSIFVTFSENVNSKTSDFWAKGQRKLSCELMFSAFRRCREHSFEKFQTNSTIRYIGNPLIWIRVSEIVSWEQPASFFPNVHIFPKLDKTMQTFNIFNNNLHKLNFLS